MASSGDNGQPSAVGSPGTTPAFSSRLRATATSLSPARSAETAQASVAPEVTPWVAGGAALESIGFDGALLDRFEAAQRDLEVEHVARVGFVWSLLGQPGVEAAERDVSVKVHVKSVSLERSTESIDVS